MIPFVFECKGYVLKNAFESGLELYGAEHGKPEFVGTERAWSENNRLMREALERYE